MSWDDGLLIPQPILRHFDLTASTYDEDRIAKINLQRRTLPDGKLFFDRLLAFAEVDGHALYPPSSPADLRRLLGAIHSSTAVDKLKKDCFYYYLLKDHDSPDSSAEEGRASGSIEPPATALSFAKHRCLPKTWRGFIDGYWALDHGLWEKGVDRLIDPSITEINFLSSIIQSLATLVSPPASACSLLHTLLLSQSFPQPETPTEEVDIYVVSLASSASVPDAFGFIRASIPEHRTRLREVVWSWAFGSPKTPCGSGEHVVQQKAVKEILHLPLTEDEDSHLVQFLLHPPRNMPPASLSLLHDMVTLRLIHQGKYAESLQLDKELAGSGGKEEDRQRRREMVREFIAILPEAQRRALAVDSEVIADKREKERLVNGFVAVPVDVEVVQAAEDLNGDGDGEDFRHAQDYDVEMDNVAGDRSWTATETGDNNVDAGIDGGIDAPHRSTPTLRTFSESLSQQQRIPSKTSLPPQVGTPLAVSRHVSTSSPFAGPPRYAMPGSPMQHPQPQLQRVLSGSPFTLPMSKGASAIVNASSSPSGHRTPKPLPRPKGRNIIDDESDNRTLGSSRQKEQQISKRSSPTPTPTPGLISSSSQIEGSDQQQPAPVHTPAQPRRSKRIVSSSTIAAEVDDHDHDHDHEHERNGNGNGNGEGTQQKLVAPPSTSKRRTTRQTTAPPPTPLPNLPGSFNFDTPSVPENDVAPAAPAPAPAPAPTPGRGGRSRMTRSVSRAILDEPDNAPAPKRSRRRPSGASEISETTAVRRSSRKTKAPPGAESERGASPTPSVAASTRSVRRTKESSQTPRPTRSTRRA